MDKRTLKEVLEEINAKGGDIVAVGAKSSFLFVGPSEDAPVYLENFLDRELDDPKKVHGQVRPSPPIYRQKDGDHALVIRIKGDECGKYWLMQELYPEIVYPHGSINYEEGIYMLAGTIISTALEDIVDWLVYKEMHPDKLFGVNAKNLKAKADAVEWQIRHSDRSCPNIFTMAVESMTAEDWLNVAQKKAEMKLIARRGF